MILFPQRKVSSILDTSKLFSGGKFSHCFQEGPLPGTKELGRRR
jgi:hypothetical protein